MAYKIAFLVLNLCKFGLDEKEKHRSNMTDTVYAV